MVRSLSVLFILLFSSAHAVGALEVSPPVPVFADLESVASARLPQRDVDAMRVVGIEMDVPCTATNAFEVSFHSADFPLPETCRLVIGLDRGKLYARGLQLASEVTDQAIQSEGSLRLELSIVLYGSGDVASFQAKVNGATNAFLTDHLGVLLPLSQPLSWRSIKVVSRGLSSGLPSVSFDDSSQGLLIRIR